MVARNFPVQDLPYSRLLQVPDDEMEFLELEELKPSSVQSYSPQQYQPTYYELHNIVE